MRKEIGVFTNGEYTMGTKFAKLALAASIVLALAFAFGCSSGDDGKDGGGDSSSSQKGGSGSSSSRPSSSSNKSSSSIIDHSIYGDPVTYGNETYKTVIIGEQTWFKKNLNYDPGTGDSRSHNGNDGETRYYDWATAMALPADCNSNSCANQITTPHKGLCPEGFHIPTYLEWGKLYQYVIANTNVANPDIYIYLSVYKSSYKNQTDPFGFSAPDLGTGSSPEWWTNEESNPKATAYTWWILSSTTREKKTDKFPIRCIKNSSSSNPNIPSKGSLVDARDGKVYKTTKIGKQNWMAENLNYDPKQGNSSSRNNNVGRYYDWATAMALPLKCNNVHSNEDVDCRKDTTHRDLCPSGWHLPSYDEWFELSNYVRYSYIYDNTGISLMATSGWDNEIISNDDFGFSALPGGYETPSSLDLLDENYGYWWASSEMRQNEDYPNHADCTYLDSGGGITTGWVTFDGHKAKTNLLNVRCVQD